MYADDTQLLYSFGMNDLHNSINTINEDLKINTNKSSVMLFGRRKTREEVQKIVIKIKDTIISCRTSKKFGSAIR